jgi:AcrR family transcriptional regulator
MAEAAGTAPRGREDSAQRLLAAAERIALREGAALISLRRIAAQSGLNSALVSYYFGGLDGLLDQLAGENLQRIDEARASQLAAVDPAASPAERLRQLVAAYMDPLWLTPAKHNPQPARAVVREVLAVLKPEARERRVSHINQSIGRIAAQVAPLLPRLGADAVVIRLRLLAGAAELMQPRVDLLGLFPTQKRRDEQSLDELRAQMMSFSIGALLAP